MNNRERSTERAGEKENDDKKCILCEEKVQKLLGGLKLALNRFGLTSCLVPLFIVFSGVLPEVSRVFLTGVLLKFLECS
jgi:hypothetical protein